MTFKTILIISLSILFRNLSAQNITGSWEGIMGNEILKININQNGDDLCGFTADKETNDPSSFCKAYFKGKYNRSTQIWTITGFKFIENSGSHILMKIRLWKFVTSDNVLRGSVSTAGSFFESTINDYFTIQKVSNKPKKPSYDLPVCYEPVKKIKPEPAPINKEKPNPKPIQKTQPEKPDNNSPAKPIEIITKDTLKKEPPPAIITKPPVSGPANPRLIDEMKTRENNTVSEIIVDTKKIQLKLYDNGEVDNDTVSLFYNGKIIKEKQRLSEKPIIIDLELDESALSHEFTLFAENLGTISPNTALIVVIAGKKRYELHSSASLSKNAVLRFKYKP